MARSFCIADQLNMWQKNMDFLYGEFEKTDRIIAHRPESSFYAFFRVVDEDDCLVFARRLIDEVGLSIAPGCAFGSVGKGYMRLCFATSQDILEDAASRLFKAI